jgi:hypothetical protein
MGPAKRRDLRLEGNGVKEMAGKTVVSTPLDENILQQLDAFCAEIHRTRAEVMRGLLYALLLDGKQNIFSEWREQVKP